jgi:hypothetical protein
MSAAMNSAISEFVLNRAQLMKRDPVDCLWIGDLIATFINSHEYAQMAIFASGQELRPEVFAFACLMEKRLREKDEDRGGNSWKQSFAAELIIPAMAKALHMDSIIRSESNPNLIPVKHAVDLANYCMMIADSIGAIRDEIKEAEYSRQIIGV